MTIKVPCRATLGAAMLWIAALVLMVYDTIDGATTMAARWSLFIGLGATSWTITLAIRHARRVVLEVMSWEHWMMDSVKKEESGGGVVRAIR